MSDLQMPSQVYYREGDVVRFNQLALKIEMDSVTNEEYFAWLDRMHADVATAVPGAALAEKDQARDAPPLNTAIYYDTDAHDILPTGALLRTSCNKITHAFCAFKLNEDAHGVRNDHRYVFEGDEKATIQRAPDSPEAVAIVKRLLARTDITHPGVYLRQHLGIDPTTLEPAIRLDSNRFTFFGWLDGKDALRCSLDRYDVRNLRVPAAERVSRPVAEVELAVYPRISEEVAGDRRVVELIKFLRDSLCEEFSTVVTSAIKYQRAAQALGVTSEVS